VDDRIKDIIQQSGKLFEKRAPLHNLWQSFAEQFYVERADFTVDRQIGKDFASHLTSSYPLLARRDLGNSISAMLRPTATPWFNMKPAQETDSHDAKLFLEDSVIAMRNAMYDTHSGFVRATKEADHDFVTFGNCVISVELDYHYNRLMYRCWHLRDVAWTEGYNKRVQDIYHKIKMCVREINTLFKGNISTKLKQLMEKDPYAEVTIMRAILDSKYYESSEKKTNAPYMSVYFECDGGHILEESPSFNQVYIIPRWQTVSGSQYAFSPATVAALPDARLFQDMLLTLLEAGQKSVNPPHAVVQDAIRGDFNQYAGGLIYLDADYDQRTGDVISPLQMGNNIPLGIDMANMTREAIHQAFFLNVLNLPQAMSGTTAYEVSQRIKEYIRGALPLFEPMETEYNGALCDMTFDVMMRAGAFGNNIPEELSGQSVQFHFISPLHDAVESQKSMVFQQARGVIAETMALDPKAGNMLKAGVALEDTLYALGVPAKWLHDREEVEAMNAQQEQMAAVQQQMQMMQQGAEAGKSIGEAGQALRGGM
jgi:hypothetical protein